MFRFMVIFALVATCLSASEENGREWSKRWWLLDETTAFLENNEATRSEVEFVIGGLLQWHANSLKLNKYIKKITEDDANRKTPESSGVP